MEESVVTYDALGDIGIYLFDKNKVVLTMKTGISV